MILALGIILNTKSGLGVSPIISVAYAVSVIGGFNFGNITFLLYSAFVLIEIVLHVLGRNAHAGTGNDVQAEKQDRGLKMLLIMDIFQLPLSLVFTRFMNLFSGAIPTPENNLLLQLAVLLAGVVFTGIGAAMSLNMRIIPNPGDGIVQAIADFSGKSVGIGLGTVIAVLGVGRVVAVFDHFLKDTLDEKAGVVN